MAAAISEMGSTGFTCVVVETSRGAVVPSRPARRAARRSAIDGCRVARSAGSPAAPPSSGLLREVGALGDRGHRHQLDPWLADADRAQEDRPERRIGVLEPPRMVGQEPARDDLVDRAEPGDARDAGVDRWNTSAATASSR